MAETYIQFSVELPIPTVADQAAEWVRSFNLDKETLLEEASLTSDRTLEDRLEEKFSGIDVFLQDGAVFVTSEGGCGNIDAAENAISSYLRHFNMMGTVFLTWAGYCSKLRPGEFGGGSSIIDRTGVVAEMSTQDLYSAQLRAVGNLLN